MGDEDLWVPLRARYGWLGEAVMAHKFALPILLPAFAFGACAGPLQETAPGAVAYNTHGASGACADSDDEFVCTTEKPTGSNIPKRICRSRAVIDKERAEAEEFVKQLNAPRPTPR
jgi:hypothetical protein